MLPVLISFHFPDFMGHLGWIEVLVTTVVLGLLFLIRRKRPGFSLGGFVLWVGVYVILRGLAWYAGPGYHFKLHTYGVLIATGFVVAITLSVRQAKREFIDPNIMLDLAFWILIAGMAGSRLLFILVNLDRYMAHPVDFLKIWTGGLVFYGGFIGAVVASWYYCYRRGISFLRIADLIIPSLAIGHFFGRLGCFTAGCCHGCATGIEGYGAVFTAAGTVVHNSGLNGVPIHPTQLYESLGELIVFMVVVKMRKTKRFHGQLLSLWLMLYPVWRLMTEMFRGDRERGMLLNVDILGDATPELLSTSQLVSLGLFSLGVFLWLRLRGSRSLPEKSGVSGSLDEA